MYDSTIVCALQYLLKHKLSSPLVLALFEVLCEEASDDNPLGILMADTPDNAAGTLPACCIKAAI